MTSLKPDLERARRKQWETFAELLKAGCSIPHELRHIEREHKEIIRRMVGRIVGRGPR